VEIDEINILQGSFLAMHRALDQLKTRPQLIIVDGNRFIPYKKTPYETIVKGDGKYQSIAAASILAKTHRDEIMRNLHEQYPHFGWDRNKGYPTKEHRLGIEKHGPTEWHRMTFQLLPLELPSKKI
jgi:ribonuclease HII